MARGSYLWDGEHWAPRDQVLAARAAARRSAVSSFPRPMVIGAMPEIRSPIDGRVYDSKSTYYRHVERSNCSIVGFDKNWERQIKKPVYDARAHEADVVADVKKSIEQVKTHGGVPNAS